MEIFTFGEGARLDFCREYFAAAKGEGRLLLLPIPTTKDNIHIKGTDLPLSEIYPLCAEGTAVACYGLPREVSLSASERGATVIDGLACEDFLLKNAELTALGAMGVILTEYKKCPAQMRVGIIGYGRIGKALLRHLLFLGAGVKVFSRSEETRRLLGERGVQSGAFPPEEGYFGLDILVNTAPSSVMGKEELSAYAEAGLGIIDLASGVCFPDSPYVKKLPSIPEAFYPESGGRLYAELIEGGMKKC